MSQRFLVVDAFTDRPFAGNPAAVCVMETAADEDWMRAVAREMNLSETAFLHPEGDAWRLRWLTPEVEVDLCGHATLASAHVLWETRQLPPAAAARFLTRSGPLGARRDGAWIVLDLPAHTVVECPPVDGLEAALGASARWLGRFQNDYVVELATAATVRALRPDLGALARLPISGVMVTAAGDEPGLDFVSRFFGPGYGIPEDPVTGSAHCALGPLWARRLGKRELVAHQASRRGGQLRVTIDGDRVQIAGKAVTVSRGEILGPGEPRLG
jgi:predicted PhzF superfamily epimerase YddE/YHI9